MDQDNKDTVVNLLLWQTKVWNDKHRYKVINIGRRGGKTNLSVLKTIDYAINNPKTISWMISPTYKQTKAIAFAMFKEFIPKAAIQKINETELTFYLKNGSTILLKGGDNPDSLRGVRIDFAIFDETAFFSRWTEVWKVVRPTLADSKADVWFISTPNGFNHFKELSEMTEEDWVYFHYTTYDNEHIPIEEIESMKAEMDEDSFAQEIMGEFRKMSGLIFKDFNRNTHMTDIPILDHSWTYTRAIDFGFAHKTAVGYFAINPKGTEMYCYDGIYESGLTTQEVAEAIKIKDAGRFITNPVADSAQPMNIEELSREGIHFSPVKKGPDSVKSGIMKLAELLKVRKDTGKPTLMFNKNLTWIADEFEQYRWIETKSSGMIREVPRKINDDFLDACRYFAMSYKSDQQEDTSNFAILRNKRVKNKWSLK